MEFRAELKWVTLKGKNKKEGSFCCPYCNTKVHSFADLQLSDVDLGAIKYHIFKCLECYMPVIIGIDGTIIPPSMHLPFGDIRYLPQSISDLYTECRKNYANGCYYSVVMVARTLLMHIAVNQGDVAGKSFNKYIDYFETKGFIGQQNKTWVDKIRTIANDYVHNVVAAQKDDAEKVILFIKQLLGTVYEMPELAR